MRWFTRMAMVAMVAAGCAGGGDTDLEAGFCDLLQNGPEQEILAADAESGAPELAIADTVVEVDLLPDVDGFWGIVAFTADEPGSFAIGLSEDITLVVTDADGAEVAPEHEVAGAACPELVKRVTYPLEQTTYFIELSSPTVEEVDIVSEESDDDLGA